MSEPAWVPIGGAAPFTMGALELIDRIDLPAIQTFSAIPADYEALKLIYKVRSTGSGNDDELRMRVNGDGGSNYLWNMLFGQASGAGFSAPAALQAQARIGIIPYNSAQASRFGSGEVLIPNYRDGQHKSWSSRFESLAQNTNAANQYVGVCGGVWVSTSPITSLGLTLSSGAFATGSVAWLYGLRAAKFPALPAPNPVGIGTSLPGSAADGQEFILTDSLTAPTYSWRFIYIAAKASNKWVFIGGAPIFTVVDTTETTASTSFAALATPGPSITVPVAGLYTVEIGFTAVNSTAGAQNMSYDIGAVAASDNDRVTVQGSNAGNSVGRAMPKTLAAGTALVSKYKTAGGTLSASFRWMRVTPVAVGG